MIPGRIRAAGAVLFACLALPAAAQQPSQQQDAILVLDASGSMWARIDGKPDLPATAAAGSTIRVAWSGPDYRSDYIAVAAPGAEGSSEITHAYTRAGSPAQLKLPDESGTYEVRYILHQSRSILAREKIEIR